MNIAELFPIRSWWAGTLNLVFPPVCVHCGRVGSFLCAVCVEEAILPADLHVLPVIPDLDDLTSCAVHDGAARSAIHALKYEGIRELTDPLGELLAEAITRKKWLFDAIIPVPLHYARLAERGYNQAELLAKAVSMHSGCPVLSDTLFRVKATASQVTLNAEARRENMQDAFVTEGLLPPRLLLIDDVCTTGSTLGAAAQVLRQAGALLLYAATVSVAQ